MAHINIVSGSCHLHTRSSPPGRQLQQIGCINVRRLAVQHRRASSALGQRRHRHRCPCQAANDVELAEAPVPPRAPEHAEEPAPEASPAATASEDEAAAGVEEGSAGGEAPAPPELAKRWQQAIQWQEEGTVCTGRIAALHKSGVVVRFMPHGLKGFLPWQRMDPQRLPDAATASQEDLEALKGQEVRAKVLQVNVPKRQVLLSERAALFREMAARLSEGDVVEGVINKVVSYGAFVNLKDADGHMGRISGMIHISELAWNRVSHPEDVVSVGQSLKCKVLRLDLEKDRIDLSLKLMEGDPLLENLDGLLPLEVNAPGLGSVPANLPSAVEDLCAALQREPGVDDISVGRQVEEKRAVSQDLELWMSKEVVEDGYNVVVRAGRLVQEIHVVTSMPAEDMKAAVQRVLRELV